MAKKKDKFDEVLSSMDEQLLLNARASEELARAKELSYAPLPKHVRLEEV